MNLKPTKILHVISSVNPLGGGPIEGINQLFKAYKNNNIVVQICSTDMPNDSWVVDTEIKVHALGPSIGKYAFCPKLIPWLNLHHKEYDLLIVNGLWQYTGFAVHWVLANTNRPYYVFTHGMLDPWFKYKYPLKHIKKWLYWPWAEFRILRDAKKVIFTSEEERLLARKSFSLYKANEEVAGYGISSPPKNINYYKDFFLTHYPNLKDKRVALFLGRIHEKKGCDLLIDAFAKIANVDHKLHLLFVGPDQMGLVKKLKNRINKLKISNQVTWIEMLRGDLKWGAIYCSEVFCLPSHQENFGIAVAEALSCGKPVLISNKVNIWREIINDNAGFVSDDTVQGTLSNFHMWLNMDTEEFEKMTNNATNCFEKNFNIKDFSERLLNIIKSNN